MNNKFRDLINQAYYFPQTSFRVENNNLLFNDIPLKKLIDRFGTPLKITYLPRIGEQIERARAFFRRAMQKVGYNEDYVFTYCTKSSHFLHVLEEVISHQAHVELSSAFDTELVLELGRKGLLPKDSYILCNGYKTKGYFEGIRKMIHAGFQNVIPILDSTSEFDVYNKTFEDVESMSLGIRMATEEEPNFDLYTSRFGIRKSELLPFFKEKLMNHPRFSLKMLHFFVYTGIRDTTYFWSEFHKYVKIYGEMKAICPSLDSLDIGGGFPIQNSLVFEYDYQYMCDEIVAQLKSFCIEKGIAEPKIFSEFGTFTVGESGATIYQVLGMKQQNDRELWYIIDNSFISTLPDMWADKQKFIMLPVNKWNKEYHRVILGGLTCDNDDYFSVVSEGDELFLPIIEDSDMKEGGEPLYVGFFHTGAYQESLSGYGGVHHCLIPNPKHILVDRDEEGELSYRVFMPEQSPQEVLRMLGYQASDSLSEQELDKELQEQEKEE